MKKHIDAPLKDETIKELNLDEIKKYEVVGVTAGASTPDFLIDEVCYRLESL